MTAATPDPTSLQNMQTSPDTLDLDDLLARKPMAAVTSLDGEVRLPMICLLPEERDALIERVKRAERELADRIARDGQ